MKNLNLEQMRYNLYDLKNEFQNRYNHTPEVMQLAILLDIDRNLNRIANAMEKNDRTCVCNDPD